MAKKLQKIDKRTKERVKKVKTLMTQLHKELGKFEKDYNKLVNRAVKKLEDKKKKKIKDSVK